jgi:hypothetical protein
MPSSRSIQRDGSHDGSARGESHPVPAPVIRVAVLGGGILGASTALFLARRGAQVTLFDKAGALFSGASRWNEGKIHLGYLYAADPSLDTARRILPGGLAFRPLVEELVDCSLAPAITPDADTFLIHRQSVVDADAAATYFDAVTALAYESASLEARRRYLAPLESTRPHRLSASELNADYNTESIAAGFRVQERSVSTNWVADRFIDALSAQPRIEQRLHTAVLGVRCTGSPPAAPLFVDTPSEGAGPFDYVVNALWEGRLAVDASLGLPLPDAWSHRFRLSVFLRTSREVHVPNTVIATGPFGDVKNYNGRDFYLSWYLSGLVAEGTDVAPPPLPDFSPDERQRTINETVERIGRVVRTVAALQTYTEDLRLAGGWVCACGQGSLADPASTLHRRDRIGITRAGRYFSVDTGKYSIAPWLAQQIAETICG